MSDFNGIEINKIGGGLGRRNPVADGTMALIAGGVATGSLALGTVAKLIQLSDAEDLGIDASYDANNGILVHHHISEFFRLSPDGTLYLMLVAQGTSMTDICDTSNDYLKKIIISETSNREIRVAGVVLNPIMATYTPTLTGGLDGDVLTAIPKAQELIDNMRADNIYLDSVIIEGREVNGTIAAMTDLRTLDCQNVSVVIAQDPQISWLDVDYADYAAVGSALGMLSIRKVHENLGSVDILVKPSIKKGDENYPLTNQANNLWLYALISSGVVVGEMSQTEKTALKNKGYVYAGGYEGYPYTYFNSSSTCTEIADDFNFIEKNRTWNKAARYVIQVLTPKINSTIDIDGNTGYIKTSTISSWEAIVKQKLGNMLTDGEVSSVEVYINPAQNVLSGEPILIQISIVPKGIAEKITVDLGFKNPLA